MQFLALALVWCSAAAAAVTLPVTLPFQEESPVSVVDLPPGPQFTPAQKQRQIQLGAALQGQIVAAHAADAAEYRVPPGNYRYPAATAAADVDKNLSIPKEFWPLVLDSLRRPADFPFTVDATGVTLWFETRGGGLASAPHVTNGLRIMNCSHLILKGLTTDFDPPNTIEGRVVKIDRPGNRLQVRSHSSLELAWC